MTDPSLPQATAEALPTIPAASMSLEGRVVLITGAARRIGRACALTFARAGADVVLHLRQDSPDAAATKQAVEATGRRCWVVLADLSQTDAVATIVPQTLALADRLDVLVNNASMYEPSDINGSSDDWLRSLEQHLRVNTLAPALLSQAAAAAIRPHGGAIVNLCDICWNSPWLGFAAYGSSKAALAHLTMAMARELAPHVRVNGVCPGIAEWPPDMPTDTRRRMLARVPLAAAGTAEHIAQAVLFLATHQYLTGVLLPVDGGRSIA